jgi:TATA-box binding protein (TBP) (component of TFIID and TFIIIB)
MSIPLQFKSPHVTIQSIQSSTQLSSQIDCKFLAIRMRNCIYSSASPNAIHIVRKNPKAKCTVFGNTGKVVIMGGKSDAEAVYCAQQVVKAIQACGTLYNIPVLASISFTGHRKNNVSASAAVGFGINLTNLSNSVEHEDKCNWNPEVFPGAYYTLREPSLKACLFSSGSVTITGSKTKDEVLEAYVMVLKIVKNFAIYGSGKTASDFPEDVSSLQNLLTVQDEEVELDEEDLDDTVIDESLWE